jgi:hypothetical protein
MSTTSFQHHVLWHHGRVEKPELVIESKPEDHFLKARCSVCPRVRFNLLGNTLDEKKLLRQMFDIHFRAVHARADASQSKDSAK